MAESPQRSEREVCSKDSDRLVDDIRRNPCPERGGEQRLTGRDEAGHEEVDSDAGNTTEEKGGDYSAENCIRHRHRKPRYENIPDVAEIAAADERSYDEDRGDTADGERQVRQREAVGDFEEQIRPDGDNEGGGEPCDRRNDRGSDRVEKEGKVQPGIYQAESDVHDQRREDEEDGEDHR